ncbi:MAG: ABC transporter permease [Cyclobacteriaceae bacterium]|nr:ABC transporter permease [Cyclobacteriaceae bacterium HetDA_MAG_MS6]
MSHPPKWALRLLRWFCREDYLVEIEGDLFELYYLRAKDSIRSANLFFVWNVFRSFRPINWKVMKAFGSPGMFRSYFKIGFRSLMKDPRFSLINLVGLSVGLSIFLIIALLVQHELSFDQFHAKGERIYQVIQVFENADGDDPEIFTSLKLSEALRLDLPMVENAVTIHGAASTWVDANGRKFFEEDGIVAGPQFFEIFDFELLAGEKSQVLSEKRSIVLSESLAQKFFDLEQPIGQEIDLGYYGRFTVSGLMKDTPANSYIQFNFIITQDYDIYFENVASWWPAWFQSWQGNPAATYVLLDDPSSKDDFELSINNTLKKYLGDDQKINRHYLLGLQDLHFNSHGIDGRVNEYVKGDSRQIQFLMGIAVVILAMACFNYINISTSRYIRRTREVGIRKAMGAYNHQVTNQFLVESFIMVLASFSLGLLLAIILTPYFHALTGIDLDFNWITVLKGAPLFIGAIVLVTLFAGFYPAFHLSRFPVVSVLKNLTISSRGNGTIRKVLVTLQYVFVISILAALIIVNKQYSFLGGRSLGFDTDKLLVIEINSGAVRENYINLKNELLQQADILNVTGLTRMISGYRSSATVNVHAVEEPMQNQSMRFYGMEADGLSTLDIELIEGSDFNGQTSLDSTSLILNETAAQQYGGHAALGQFLKIESATGSVLQAKVVGIAKDFHYRSLHEPIGPVVIGYYLNPIEGLDDIVVRLKGAHTRETLEIIEKIHNKYDTNDVMTWEFMDDMIQRAYEKELIFHRIFIGASVVSIVIALLGVIGLAAYFVVSKSKEFGIRKVLGASFADILLLQEKGFFMLILLASMIAIPLSWILADLWLVDYAYRVELTASPFFLAVLSVGMLTAFTIYLVGYRIANENPVNSLKYE